MTKIQDILRKCRAEIRKRCRDPEQLAQARRCTARHIVEDGTIDWQDRYEQYEMLMMGIKPVGTYTANNIIEEAFSRYMVEELKTLEEAEDFYTNLIESLFPNP